MVFSSLPIYLDPPNWNQQTSHQAPSSAAINHPPQLMAEPPPPHPMGLQGPTRPVSMAERARLAKIPQPEPALKCPRCDSTNTKFCYFNNYSLSQPRHFCKTCRRYWTRGGALRNVPVGGGCRRNKRTKPVSTSSKPSFSAGGSSSSAASGSFSSTTILPPPPPPQLPFLTHFQQLGDYAATNIGLGFPGIHPLDAVDYQIGVGGGGGGGLEQWRMQQMQQFPFMGGIDVSSTAPTTVTGLYPFDGESGGSDQGFSTGRMLTKASSSGLISQLASVKMEDSSHGINLQRQYLGTVAGNDQYWDGNGDGGATVGNVGGSGWLGDLSGFNSSSSGNIL